jgi:ABC-type phosphate transport system substrate-binding protein
MPTLDSTTAAAQAVASSGCLLVMQAGQTLTYLTSTIQTHTQYQLSYLLSYKELNVIPGMTQDKATAVVQFLWYIVHDGQDLAPALEYAPLPSNVVALNEATLRSITFNGQTLI